MPADDEDAHRIPAIVDLARRAPSVHNTQPWLWRRTAAHQVELWADPERQLAATDPVGRNLTISCGAALHYFVTAAKCRGWTATIDYLPSPHEDDLLAQISLRRAQIGRDANDLLDALANRCTDRRRFTSWPVPEARIGVLLGEVSAWGGQAVSISDPADRLRVDLLDSRAAQLQRAVPELVAEQSAWIDHSRHDGLLGVGVAHDDRGLAGSHRNRFDLDADPLEHRPGRRFEATDGVIVVGTEYDGPLSWLHAGAALSALWLRATGGGLSVVPLTQVIEVDETRHALRHGLLANRFEPHVVTRIGWQEIGRSDLPRTPRRPLAEVYEDATGS